MSIVNRKGVYFVTYHEITYKIKVNSFAKKISSMKIVFNKDMSTLFTKQDSVHIEHALKSYRKMGVLALSVDKKENVLLSIPWSDRCTYYFLKLSPTNTLEDIKKQYYQNYENNWYLDKECSER